MSIQILYETYEMESDWKSDWKLTLFQHRENHNTILRAGTY